MTKSITAVGFSLTADQSELLEQKFKRIAYAEQHIENLSLKIKEDNGFVFDATISFHWGIVAHVNTTNYDFAAGVNKLMDQLDEKINKEKDKIQSR